MTVVSGRAAHVPLLLEAVMVTRLSVTVTVTHLLVLLFLKVVMIMMGVFLSLSSPSLFTSTLTPTTEACSAH